MPKLTPFIVDEAGNDEEIFTVDVPSRAASVQIKIAPDGIYVDVWPAEVADEPVSSMFVLTEDLVDYVTP